MRAFDGVANTGPKSTKSAMEARTSSSAMRRLPDETSGREQPPCDGDGKRCMAELHAVGADRGRDVDPIVTKSIAPTLRVAARRRSARAKSVLPSRSLSRSCRAGRPAPM
jgi:hypothetical protein